nr:malonyl-CoA decarboxylase [Aestuariicella albida]
MRGERRRFVGEAVSEIRVEQLCDDLLSSKGEALGTALACSVAEAFNAMNERERLDFFHLLAERYGASKDKVEQAIAHYQTNKTSANLHALHRCSEPPRQELFRRINMAPGGTQTLVHLREYLLPLLTDYPEFVAIETDLHHLMTSWFNRGFLRLERIDWHTPAFILEKLITYEAVHEMSGWEDLRRRLADDRRCFAFFHPAMEHEPLIFVEVALCQGLAESVQKILSAEVDPGLQAQADTAIFYSISDCQAGLKGISFGNFLIKQVVMELQQELPNLQHFATLSPIPGFCRWLHAQIEANKLSEQQLRAIDGFDQPIQEACQSRDSAEACAVLMPLCAEYLYRAKRGSKPLDPVSRFHLRNGASIGQLNWNGDTSAKGMRQSAGIMVNYTYNLGLVEERHEDYVNDNLVMVEKDFYKYLAPESNACLKS